jgi:hypothetical protein
MDFHFSISFLSIETPLHQPHLPLCCGLFLLKLLDFVPQHFHDRRRARAGIRDLNGSRQLRHGLSKHVSLPMRAGVVAYMEGSVFLQIRIPNKSFCVFFLPECWALPVLVLLLPLPPARPPGLPMPMAEAGPMLPPPLLTLLPVLPP